MRSVLFGAAVAGVLVSSSHAADLPLKAPAVAPLPAAIGWTGWYVGANAGYHMGSGGVSTAADPGPFDVPGAFGAESIVAAALATNSGAPRQRGFIGGGQIGYNWQFAPQWVAGLEADIQGLSGTGSATIVGTSAVPGFPTEAFSSTTQVTKKVEWLSTLRGRVGILATPALLAYATGGLAVGQVKATTTIAQTDTGINGALTGTGATAGSISQTRAGWALGGGAEWKFAPHWSVKGEYLHYDLGSVTWNSANMITNVTGFGTPTYSAANIRSSTRFQGDIVRAGLNYLF